MSSREIAAYRPAFDHRETARTRKLAALAVGVDFAGAGSKNGAAPGNGGTDS